jgi:hypothetical protein
VYRLTGLAIFCRTSGLVSTFDFVAEMGLFTVEYRLNGPHILSRISEIVRFGGLSGIAPPEALGSIGFPTISSMSFSHCCE